MVRQFHKDFTFTAGEDDPWSDIKYRCGPCGHARCQGPWCRAGRMSSLHTAQRLALCITHPQHSGRLMHAARVTCCQSLGCACGSSSVVGRAFKVRRRPSTACSSHRWCSWDLGLQGHRLLGLPVGNEWARQLRPDCEGPGGVPPCRFLRHASDRQCVTQLQASG
jgi:hypothetical protein